MKRLVVVTICLVALTSAFSIGQYKSIVDFFPHVDSLTIFPPVGKGLTILCQKRIAQRYVSFVGIKGKDKVLLVAVTLQRLTDVQKSISLIVQFDETKRGINPNPGKVSTWGFVFDRNGDGKIDYMALVGGAAAFKKEDLPENYPLLNQPSSFEHMELLVSHCKIVFNHWADDNFDDTLDALIHIDLDPRRDWVERRMVIRSTKFNNKFDDVWAFRNSMTEEYDTVSHTSQSVPYHPIGKPTDEITKETLMDKTRIMLLIHRAAEQCGLKKEQFMYRYEWEE